MVRLNELLLSAEQTFMSIDECFDVMRAIPLERFDCPVCKSMFVSRLEAAEHMSLEHGQRHEPRPMHCEVSGRLVCCVDTTHLFAGLPHALHRPQRPRSALKY